MNSRFGSTMIGELALGANNSQNTKLLSPSASEKRAADKEMELSKSKQFGMGTMGRRPSFNLAKVLEDSRTMLENIGVSQIRKNASDCLLLGLDSH
ncbi:MAG: hypothetical protein P4M11_13905 [Candidatus Pacebacteria bacterium]|nr:hypothetical protein [Candidatus Paceibacterota bacterium]